MNIEYIDNNVVLKNVTSFSLEQTLDCGQCFRWEKTLPNTQGEDRRRAPSLSEPRQQLCDRRVLLQL